MVRIGVDGQNLTFDCRDRYIEIQSSPFQRPNFGSAFSVRETFSQTSSTCVPEVSWRSLTSFDCSACEYGT
jgi:hypothetical protein